MTLTRLTWVLCSILLLTGGPAFASFFASDLIIVPVAAANAGLEDSFWRTDLYITNVDEVSVDVSIYFFPESLADNSVYLNRQNYGLGGRDSEGFAHVSELLADIPPNGTVVIEDVLGTYWVPQLSFTASLGGLVVFAYEAGTLDADGGQVNRNVIVQSRTYNDTTIWVEDPDNAGQFIEQEATYGQTIPGIPWYNLVDAGAKDDDLGIDFTYQILTGAQENDVYRFNVGLFNTSDPQTTITVRLEPIQADGEPFVDDQGEPRSRLVTLGPLGHIQFTRVLASSFGLSDVTNASLRVSFVSWSTRGTNPIPMFATYAAITDGRSNDPTTVMPSFNTAYDVSCMWPNPAAAAAEPADKARSSANVIQAGISKSKPLTAPRRDAN